MSTYEAQKILEGYTFKSPNLKPADIQLHVIVDQGSMKRHYTVRLSHKPSDTQLYSASHNALEDSVFEVLRELEAQQG